MNEVSEVKEFRRGWKILVLAFLGVATSASVMPLYGFGSLLIPLQDAFSWSRSELMATTSFFTFGGIFSSILAGWLNNRFGLRPVALWSFLGLFLSLLLITQLRRLGGSIVLFYFCYTLIGFAGVGTLQVTWTQLVNDWYEKNRGLALAIILSGSGFMGMILPLLLTSVIDQYDWSAAFVVMALIPVLITLPLALRWLRTSPQATEHSDVQLKATAVTGVSYAEGIRDWRFWMLTLSLSIVAAAVIVVVVNGVPILMDKGYSAKDASKLFGVFGISLIAGRVVVGMLVDRLWAPGVAFFVFLLCAWGCFLLATVSDSASTLVLALALLGIGAGAEFDLAAFLVARYFGMRDYARLFGLHMGALSAGICTAPITVALSYKLTNSYSEILIIYAGMLVVSAFLILTIGRYPTLVSSESDSV